MVVAFVAPWRSRLSSRKKAYLLLHWTLSAAAIGYVCLWPSYAAHETLYDVLMWAATLSNFCALAWTRWKY